MPTRKNPDRVMTVAERQRAVLTTLRREGGDKVCALLDAESLGHLNTIIATEGFGTLKGRTEAIRFALAKTAKSYARRAKKITPK